MSDRKVKVPSGVHQQAIAHFAAQWAVKYGCQYPFNGGKDGTAFSWMLAQVEYQSTRIIAIIDAYLRDCDEFIIKNRHSVGVLRYQFQRYIATNTPPQLPPAATGGPAVRFFGKT